MTRSRNLCSGRPATKGGWIPPSKRIAWGDALRAALAKTPTATVAQLAEQTGAPPELTRQVRLMWLRRRAVTS